MIINVTGGGGGSGGFNFKIVGGTTEPSNPKENTIWVHTDQKITGWSFNDKEPTNPFEGLIWILNISNKKRINNGLKKNEIALYIAKTKQYLSGEWVDMFNQVFLDGSWTRLATYLYDNGDQCTDISGGWAGYAQKEGNDSAQAPTVTHYDDHVNVNFDKQYGGSSFHNGKAMSFDGYDTLYIVLDAKKVWELNVRVTTTVSGRISQGEVAKAVVSTTGMQTITIPIAELNDSYYINFGQHFYGDGTLADIDLYEIYLV